MENGWHPKEKLGNRNVPRDSKIIGSVVSMSGEIITTYYVLSGKHYKVGAWVYEKPEEVVLIK